LIIGITFPVLGIMGTVAAVLYSNKRMDDVHKRIDGVEKRIDEMKKELIDHMDKAFAHMELLLKLHEAEHHKH